MKRKIDELLNENKKKEKMLLELKTKLDTIANIDQKDKQTTFRVK